MISGQEFIEYLKRIEIPPEPPEGSSINGNLIEKDIEKYMA